MKTLNIILAALGGVVAGAALGLAFAPKKGKELRQDIVDFIEDKCPFMKRNKIEELAERIAEEIKA